MKRVALAHRALERAERSLSEAIRASLDAKAALADARDVEDADVALSLVYVQRLVESCQDGLLCRTDAALALDCATPLVRLGPGGDFTRDYYDGGAA